jgi:hypothetical protein
MNYKSFSMLVEDSFKHWKMPYMLDEINSLRQQEFSYHIESAGEEYRSLCQRTEHMSDAAYERFQNRQEENKIAIRLDDYKKHLEYYKKTYTKIVEICDKAAILLNSDFGDKVPNILERYSNKKEEIKLNNYYDTTKFIRGSQWIALVSTFIYELLLVYSAIHDSVRFSKFIKMTNFSISEAESIMVYMKDKYDIKITNYDNNFNEIPFKKDTLLAMRALNKFSSKNSISTNDTLELFSEYVGAPFFEYTDEYT